MEGQCHFLDGNRNATNRIKILKQKLAVVNIDAERLEFFNLSAAQGPRWAEICTEFTEKVRALGPSPVRVALEKKQSYKENPEENL